MPGGMQWQRCGCGDVELQKISKGHIKEAWHIQKKCFALHTPMLIVLQVDGVGWTVVGIGGWVSSMKGSKRGKAMLMLFDGFYTH